MTCPNDARRKSKYVSFRMTPDEAEWLDDVVAESGMTKQDFILTRLREEAITVVPNVRVQRALRVHMDQLYAELLRVSDAGDLDERLICAIDRLSRLYCELCGQESEKAAKTVSRSEDIFGMSRL